MQKSQKIFFLISILLVGYTLSAGEEHGFFAKRFNKDNLGCTKSCIALRVYISKHLLGDFTGIGALGIHNKLEEIIKRGNQVKEVCSESHKKVRDGQKSALCTKYLAETNIAIITIEESMQIEDAEMKKKRCLDAVNYLATQIKLMQKNCTV